MKVLENFLTSDEEEEFLKEIEPYLKRMRYEFDHWDDVSQLMVFEPQGSLTLYPPFLSRPSMDSVNVSAKVGTRTIRPPSSD
jgi:hypothetical protein